ncbi:hypothetical protein [Mangrovimonas sp. ST2L15]|uniref:hypothetical protein n=1 Tax=Mangrovimonas sp. ST2L15 TaxID=1645916 RepID=UPI000B278BF6|nr:hypothetical protein [Mangrovimonas sp. ST2L15]
MKKSINLIYFILLIVSSCHTATYLHDLESTPYGIDYREGKWLLNDPNVPYSIQKKQTKLAYTFFYNQLGSQLVVADSLPYALPHLPINPDTLRLENFKKITHFDYVINIESKSIEDDIGSFKIGKPYGKSKNRAYTILQVYDLNTLETIYSRKVLGQVTLDEKDNNDLTLVKSTNGLMVSALKKILRKIK